MKRILFITHDASRTGAPLLLLYFIRWLKAKHSGYTVEVLALRGGAIEGEFEHYADCYFELNKPPSSRTGKIAWKVLNKIHKQIAAFFFNSTKEQLAARNYDLIYCNSVLTLEVGVYLKRKRQSKLLCHVHELSTIISIYTPNFKTLIPAIDAFMGVSKIVCTNLVEMGIDAEKVYLVYEYIEALPVSSHVPTDDRFVVGGAGTVHWRKGHDIFIQVANEILKSDENIYFIWVGAINKVHEIIVREDIRKLGLQDRVTFIGEVDEPFSYFQKFDVFFLPSREDPFPLVCLETGRLGKPIICFDQAGGIPELIEGGGGKIVPYLDVSAASKAILHYYQHPEDLKQDQKRIKDQVKSFTVDKAAPQILGIINELI
jgi:glycosyltransferase involved in cell wall biosynthesis